MLKIVREKYFMRNHIGKKTVKIPDEQEKVKEF